MNQLSEIAIDILKQGTKDKAIFEDNKWRGIIEECYNPPERPKSFKLEFQKKKDTPIVVLMSGGLDSYLAYEKAKKVSNNVITYYCRIPTKYTKYEEEAIKKLGIKPIVINFPFKKNYKGGVWRHIIPGRNLYFICSVAEQMKEGGEIWLAANDGEIPNEGGDKSLRFKDEVNKVLSYLPKPISVKYVFEKETKSDAVGWYLRQGLSIKKLKQTRTCQNSTKEHCGECQACFRRAIAFYNNGILEDSDFIKDPFKYAIKDYLWKFKKTEKEFLKGDFSKYSPNAYYEIKKVLNDLNI